MQRGCYGVEKSDTAGDHKYTNVAESLLYTLLYCAITLLHM